MSPNAVERRPEQDPPLANWLVALSHDSPLKQCGGGTARPYPPLAAVPELLSLLKDANPSVRQRTTVAVGDLVREIRRVLPALRTALTDAALHDEDDTARAEAVQALLGAGPQPATEVAALVDSLQSEIDVMRFHAATALADLGPAARQAVPALIHASLWDEEPAVRVGSAIALWRIDQNRDSLTVHVLTKALEDSNELVIWVAADALAQMARAAREAAPALREALQREYRLAVVRTSIEMALERIGPQNSAKTA